MVVGEGVWMARVTGDELARDRSRRVGPYLDLSKPVDWAGNSAPD